MGMTWILGIDFGTSYTTAAIRGDGRPEPIEIDGQRRMPSVVLVDEDGSIVVGTAAESLSATRPGCTLREPKRRLGEPAPVVLGGQPYSVVDLVGALLAAVFAEAVRHQGSEPIEIRLTHPASWGRPRLAELRRAAAIAGMSDVILVPEPVAAAVAYANDAEQGAGVGYVAVYDLGGGTFDTAVLRHTDDGFTIQGRPGGDPRLGGELFDELLARHVIDQFPAETATALVASDELAWRQAAANLRSGARTAKETLSSRDYAELLVALPTGLTQVRVTRAELESLMSDHIDESVDLLKRAIADAGVAAVDLSAIYVTGGASRSPMIEERLRAEFPSVTVSRRNDPKMVVALGATLPEATTALDVTREVAVVDEPTLMKRTVVSTEELPVEVLAGGSSAISAAVPEPDFDRESAVVVEPMAATPDSLDAPEGPAGQEDLRPHNTHGTRVENGTVVGESHVFTPNPTVFEPDVATVGAPMPVLSGERVRHPRRRKHLVAAAAALSGVLALSGIAFAVRGGDSPSKSTAGPTSPPGPGESQQIDSKSVKFGTVSLPSGMKLHHTWQLSGQKGDVLRSTLKVANPTDKVQLDTFEEIVPKEIAKDVSQLTPLPGSPPWVVVRADPIVRYSIGVEAGKTKTFGYTVKVPGDGPGLGRIKAWIVAYNRAVASRKKEIGDYLKSLDLDGDGVQVPADACPDQPAPGIANGCPPADPDVDQDGVAIPNDQCPAEKAPGTKDGCPLNRDADGDGVLVPTDRCPENKAPGTRDGCPANSDADGDGVAIPGDRCPAQSAPGTADGCPIPDRDGDGVADSSDQCPDQPANGGANGCQLPTISISPNPATHCVTGSTDPTIGLPFHAQTANATSVTWTSVSSDATGFDYRIHFGGGAGWTTVVAVARGPGGEATATWDIYVTSPTAPACP